MKRVILIGLLIVFSGVGYEQPAGAASQAQPICEQIDETTKPLEVGSRVLFHGAPSGAGYSDSLKGTIVRIEGIMAFVRPDAYCDSNPDPLCNTAPAPLNDDSDPACRPGLMAFDHTDKNNYKRLKPGKRVEK